jgi:hypothetical protein
MYAIFGTSSTYTPEYEKDVAAQYNYFQQPFHCKNASASDYWRITDTIGPPIKSALAAGLQMENMCSCSYDRETELADLFCKPVGGCGEMGSVSNGILARSMASPFSCPKGGG